MPPDILMIFLTLKGNLLFLSNESRKLTNNFAKMDEIFERNWKNFVRSFSRISFNENSLETLFTSSNVFQTETIF